MKVRLATKSRDCTFDGFLPGGNLTFTPGKDNSRTGEPPVDGDIIFEDADGGEHLRLTKEGAYVRGKLIDYPVDLLSAFCDWLRLSNYVVDDID